MGYRPSYCCTKLGRYRMRSGTKKKIAIRNRSMTKNGMMPLNTVSERIPVVPATTNALMPTGGVTMPISMNLTIRMPNQIGSNPNSSATGSSRGTEIISSDSDSSTMPIGIKLNNRMSMAIWGAMFQDSTASVIIFGTRAAMKNEDNMADPITMKNTMAVVEAVFCSALVIPAQMPLAPSLRSSNSKMMTAAMAPNAADSVAVKMPEYMPPNTIVNRMTM